MMKVYLILLFFMQTLRFHNRTNIINLIFYANVYVVNHVHCKNVDTTYLITKFRLNQFLCKIIKKFNNFSFVKTKNKI